MERRDICAFTVDTCKYLQKYEGLMSELFTEGQTPEAWSEQLGAHGVHVSPRLIRTKARASGQFYKLGRLMLLTPAQMERLIENASDEDETAARSPR